MGNIIPRVVAVVGALFYNEKIDFSVMIGAAVIFAGTWYSIRRETTRLPLAERG